LLVEDLTAEGAAVTATAKILKPAGNDVDAGHSGLGERCDGDNDPGTGETVYRQH
jgi:hypothetical protein